MEEEIEHIKDLKKDLDYIVENKTLDTEVELLNAHRKSMAISFVLNELERLQKENKYLRDENNIYRNETVSKSVIRDELKDIELAIAFCENENRFKELIIKKGCLKELLGE